jgi:beta-glucosidase
LDTAAGNILRALLKLTPDIKPEEKTAIGCDEHCMLSREAAAKGMVLLKNDGLLPLKKDTKIAVTGPYANVVNTGDKGSSQVKSRYHITPYQGIKRAFGVTALYNGTSLPKALKAAGDAGTVVVCAGFDHKTEGELIMKARYGARRKQAGKGGDRERLGLTAKEIELIKGLKEAGKKIIVCLIAGGAVLTSEWKEYADAIIMMYYGGLEGGNALADILCGDVCPGGKLPFTVAKDERDYPAFMELGDKPYRIDYNYYHGYTLFEKKKTEPEYPFGFGLSYTTFDISDIRLRQPAGEVTLSALITNTGNVKGAEVIQVYAGSEEAGKDRPVKFLKGFKRVELKPGEERRVNITIETDDLKFYDPIKRAWELDRNYIFYVGSSSSDAERNRLKVQF